ncbi:RNA polymerase sigma factor [Actinoallomurus iriomotensis]|uniref:DNA-directed RNA polymerase sigma-70 factor n=1 Tax=Actinoallomurus iriomotensis TaxID=478107 RepID=A0A9W6VZM3_9ACTN|nr:RNA polymerase sigma factor [Actinoallomurus iriomotensis]GLY91343.1 DNA-directed RNA polymerase sigma-70 factor [Actinoallomurus iriomotensis]
MAEESQIAAEYRSLPGDDDSDDAGVIQLSWREPERFEAVFHRHAPQITRYVTRRLGPGPAEDIVAETFLLAFQKRKSYDLARRDARPWLYGIATNLIRRHMRDEVRLLRVLERTGADPVTESFTERADSRISADAVSRRLAAAIAALPAKHRDVLLLLTWADLTYDQVGQALGVSSGTVRSRMNRIRTKLRRTLGGVDPTNVREEPVNG